MAFTKKIPEWNASGVEPPQSLKDSGWKPGVKPAADHFNWLQTTASEAIKELQQKAGEVKKVNGQLPDANGNVNVNIDTSKLATKEELSSASTYIQQEMNDLEQTVVAHQADLASQASGKGASLIGINDSANQFTATNVEGALSELFTSVSNGKTQVANAITAKGQTASGNDTFAQLATAISAINTGKKWASGTVTSVNTNTTISGLPFTPSYVFFYSTHRTNTSESQKALFGLLTKDALLTLVASNSTTKTTYYGYTVRVDTSTNTVSYLGSSNISSGTIILPTATTSAFDFNWIAFE